MRPATDQLSRGETLGRYEIIERIAVGGMAEIYVGRVRGTAGFDKLVAIKRILPHVAIDAQFVEMFLAEARLAATLHHPNIADVFDVGIERGNYFFAMELVHGQDLRTLHMELVSRRQQIPLEIALAIITNVAQALQYAHTRVGPNNAPLNLVHRDVSPSNILVSYEGAVKLVDFGIARAGTSTSTSVTRTGQLKGKIPYMSPEQCRAKPLDGRADLFSLGTVLYELTTNVRPFDGKGDFDTLERIVHGVMRTPSEVVPTYPPALEAVVMKMLANKRANRYQTAEALVAALEQVAQDEGLFVSAFMVGKYMRELFPQDAANLPHFEVEPSTDGLDDASTIRPRLLDESGPLDRLGSVIELPDPSPGSDEGTTNTPNRYPRAHGTSGMFAIEVSTAQIQPPPTEEPPPEELKVVFRPPSVEGTPSSQLRAISPFLDEGLTYQGEITHADLMPPFDPIAIRGAQLLAAIDPSLDDRETLSLNTIGELLQRAATWSEAGDLETAIIALDLILSADRTTPGVLDLLAKNFPFMTAIFEAYLGDRSRMLALSRQFDEIGELHLDRRTAYVLSMIDGTMSATELIERADMPTVEAYRHLSQLVLRRVVMLV